MSCAITIAITIWFEQWTDPYGSLYIIFYSSSSGGKLLVPRVGYKKPHSSAVHSHLLLLLGIYGSDSILLPLPELHAFVLGLHVQSTQSWPVSPWLERERRKVGFRGAINYPNECINEWNCAAQMTRDLNSAATLLLLPWAKLPWRTVSLSDRNRFQGRPVHTE